MTTTEGHMAGGESRIIVHGGQVVTAAGSGCAAALDAERWLADQDDEKS